MSYDFSNTFDRMEKEEKDLEEKENGLGFDLYQFLPPPNPLIQKNKYTESTPKSVLALGLIKRFVGTENEELQSKERKKQVFDGFTESSISSLYTSKNVVYKRSKEKSDFYNINKSVKNECNNKLSIIPEPCAEAPSDLIFESRFESGNLDLAVKVSDYEYNLLMQNDINTKGHTQWFYFKVQNKTRSTYTFHILNFTKPDSLFNHGMKILLHSSQTHSKTNITWFRGCENITYSANSLKRGSKSFYTLSFTYTFPYENDEHYFAYSFPYTYSDLMEDLKLVENFSFVNRKLLCFDIGGNRCDYLTITAPGTPEQVKSRKGVVFTGRVHPGETVGSWMVRGLLFFLTSNVPEAETLRKRFVFKIVPMMNPDGVIHGNYRCGLAGVDLNRRWKRPNEKIHPTVYYCKKLVKAFAKERSLELVCDFHGHSRKKNVFAYGCNLNDDLMATRLFPFILARESKFFSYKFSSFKMQKAKEATMRICLFKEVRVPMVYTIEASFCGCDLSLAAEGQAEETHFTTKNLERMGQDVCLALLAYSENKELGRISDCVQELSEIKDLESNVTDDSSSSGSDSDPSEDNLDIKDLKVLYSNQKSTKVLKDLRKYSRSESSNKKENVVKACFFKNNLQSSRDNKKTSYFAKPLRRKTAAVIGREKNFFSMPYFNIAGRKVRDQASQTFRDDKGNFVVDADDRMIRNFSTACQGEGEKSYESSAVFRMNNGLPSIGRNNKTFVNFVVGEKLKTNCNFRS